MDIDPFDRDKPASRKQAASDSGSSVTSLTRRGFVTGGAVTALSVPSALALAQPGGWSWEVEPDPDFPDRSIFAVRHPLLGIKEPPILIYRRILFPEIAFGEEARISILPIANREGGQNVDGSIDFRLSVAGAQLLPQSLGDAGNRFDLDFDFYHGSARGRDPSTAPSFDIQASGWAFGTGRPARLADRIMVEDLSTHPWAPVFLDPAAKDLPKRFFSALFGELAVPPDGAPIRMGMSLAFDVRPVFSWLVESLGNTTADRRQLFRVQLASDLTATPAAGRRDRPVVLAAPGLRISRDLRIARTEKLPDCVLGEFTKAIPGGTDLTLAKRAADDSATGAIKTVLSEVGIPERAVCTIARLRDEAGNIVVEANIKLAGQLSVLSGAPAKKPKPDYREGPFPVSEGVIKLTRKVAETSLGLDAEFQIAGHRFNLPTAFGTFAADAPEPKRVVPDPAEKKSDPLPAPIRVRAAKWPDMTDFEATVRLRGAAISLPEKTGTTSAEPRHLARLDFPGGAEVLFRIQGLAGGAGARARIGLISLGTPSKAKPASDAYGPPYSIPMENAVLQVTRDCDLTALKFRFLGLDLVKDGKVVTLRPRGLAQVLRVDAKADADQAGVAMSGAVHDPRSLLIVEFPPQHRAEQAFFERRAERPEPPKFPDALRGVKTIQEDLEYLHGAYLPTGDDSAAAELARKRKTARARLLKVIIEHESVKSTVPGKYPKLYDALAKAVTAAIGEDGADPRFCEEKPDDAVSGEEQAKKDEEVVTFAVFAAWFLRDACNERLPSEQTLYVGREFLDPDSRRLAEKTQKSITGSTGDHYSKLLRLGEEMPLDPVSHEEMLGFIALTGKPVSEYTPELWAKLNAQILSLREERDPRFEEFRAVYREADPFQAAKLKGLAFKVDPKVYPEQNGLSEYAGREYLRAALVELRKQASVEKREAEFVTWSKDAVDKLPEVRKIFEKAGFPDILTEHGEKEPIIKAVQTRLSGPSRLVFKINTDDYETGGTGGVIPFTFDDLTNWSRFELSVVRRAQKLFKTYKDGTRRPFWDQEEDLDLANMLVHQGFSRGGYGDLAPPAEKVEHQEASDQGTAAATDACVVDYVWRDRKPDQNWPEAQVTVEQRLAEVAKLATDAPGPTETAIELPFRLHLSPSQDALFRTPRVVPDALFTRKEYDEEFPYPTNIPLWTAELDPGAKAAMRAIWSPDFRPEAFLARTDAYLKSGSGSDSKIKEVLRWFFPRKKSRVNRAPLRGPFPPWALGRHLSSADLAGASQEMKERFRTSLDAFDRHELVALSSLHGLPVTGKVSIDGKARIGIDQREPPKGFRVSVRGCDATTTDETDFSDIYVPRPLDPKGFELMLTALGGYLSVNASFDPPAPILDNAGNAMFDALSIEAWRHHIVLGRDISSEVVYKGYLMPFGIRATLVKTTQRVFERTDYSFAPVAVLRQRMFIRIAKRVKEFPAFGQADDGRRVPFRKIEILTKQSPDIVDPFELSGAKDATLVWPSGLIELPEPRTPESTTVYPGTPFWPRTARRDGGEVMFDVLFDDKVRVRLPMVFVDNVTACNQDSLKALCTYYNLLSEPDLKLGEMDLAPYRAHAHLVRRPFFGQKVIYAPSVQAGDTEFETDSITFAVEGRQQTVGSAFPISYRPLKANIRFATDAFLQGADQPPFYPAMREGLIQLGPMARLSGQGAEPVRVGYDTLYAIEGFDPPGPTAGRKNELDVFLSLADGRPLAFGNQGERGGAVARPQLEAKALSRSRGPLGHDPAPVGENEKKEKAPEEETDFPAMGNRLSKRSSLGDFFPKDAKLLGIVKFKDLLELISRFSGVEPVLREVTEFAGGVGDEADQFVRLNVLVPIKAALAAFTKRIGDLQYRDLAGPDVLKEVYPEIAGSLGEFSAAVETALAAAPPSEDLGQSITVYSAVYSSGRRFAEATARAARDPVTPLREAMRRRLDGIVRDLNTALEKTVKDLRDTLDVKALRGALNAELRNLLIAGGKPTAIARLFLRLPMPALLELDDATREKLAAVFDATIAKTIDVLTEPGSEILFKFLEVPANRDAGRVIAFLKDRLLEQLETQATEELKPAIAEVKSRIAAASDVIEGALYDVLIEALTQILPALLETIDITKGAIGTAAAKLIDLGGRIGKLLESLNTLAKAAERFNEKYQNTCADLVALVDSYVRAVTPVDELLELPVWLKEKPLADIHCRTVAEAVGHPLYQFGGLLVRACDDVDVIATKVNDLLDQLAAATGPVKGLAEKVKRFNDGFKTFVAGKRAAFIKEQIVLSLKGVQGAVKRYDDELKAAKACKSISELPTGIVELLTTLDVERRRLAKFLLDDGIVAGVPAITTTLAKFVEDIAPDLRNGSSVEVTGTISADNAPTGDPQMWDWRIADVSVEPEALRILETARRDILGLFLPVLGTAGIAVSSVTLVATLFEKFPGAPKEKYDVFLGKLRAVLEVASLESAVKAIDDIRQALTKEGAGPLRELIAAGQAAVTRQVSANAKILSDKARDDLADLGVQISKNAELTDGIKFVFAEGNAGLLAFDDLAHRLLDIAGTCERTVLQFLLQGLSFADGVATSLLGRVVSKFVAPIAALAELYRISIKKRQEVFDAIKDPSDGGVLGGAQTALNQGVRGILAACPLDITKPGEDALKSQHARIQVILGQLGDDKPGDRSSGALSFVKMLEEWRDGKLDCEPGKPQANAFLIIIENVKKTLEEAARGDFSRLVDLDLVRREIEGKLKDLIPAKLTLAYDFDTEVGEFGGIFLPDPGTRLTLKARTSIDLLRGGAPSVFVSGDLGPFAVRLVGNIFDVVTLKFVGAKYGSETGGKLKTAITGVKLGKMVEFLDQFSQYFSFGDDGFFLSFRWDLPGIEAGYRMPPIYLTLGGLNISNVSLNASCILPFSDGEAMFKVGLSRPESPFAITSTIFGGCGHLALYATAAGIVGFTASMEFGAIVDFRLGPVAGRGQVTAGVYIRSYKSGDARVSTIDGIFTAAGSANIAIFRISAMLQVRVGQQPSGKVAGTATFVFSFSMGVKDIEFRFVIYKEEGKGFSGGGSGLQSASALGLEPPIRYAEANIASTMTDASSVPADEWRKWREADQCGATIQSIVECKGDDFATYTRYFSEVDPWIPL